MPNLKAAKKDLRQTVKKTEKNLHIAQDIKTLIKKIRKSIEAKEDPAKVKENFKNLQKMLDKAVSKNIMKKNTADRNKSRLANLMKKFYEKK